MRWFTRLTNAFSEKVENHCQALHCISFLQFLWRSKDTRRDPAMAADVVETIATQRAAETPIVGGPYNKKLTEISN
jgi:hypothetical protein